MINELIKCPIGFNFFQIKYIFSNKILSLYIHLKSNLLIFYIMANRINIKMLLAQIFNEFEQYNPKYYMLPDDPRLDTYYVSIDRNNYIVLYGICGECDEIAIFNSNNTFYDITTQNGLEMFANKLDDNGNDVIICELNLLELNCDMNNAIALIKNALEHIIQ